MNLREVALRTTGESKIRLQEGLPKVGMGKGKRWRTGEFSGTCQGSWDMSEARLRLSEWAKAEEEVGEGFGL